jgi:hypothetical protein
MMFERSVSLILYVNFVIRIGSYIILAFLNSFHRPGGYHCFPLLGGLVLGNLVTLAGVLRMCQCMSMYKPSILHQLTSDLVSTSRGVHALNGLALLESGGGGGLGV